MEETTFAAHVRDLLLYRVCGLQESLLPLDVVIGVRIAFVALRRFGRLPLLRETPLHLEHVRAQEAAAARSADQQRQSGQHPWKYTDITKM